MIVERMFEGAAAQAAERKLPRMAAWSVGKCVRQLWFMEHEAVPEPLPPRTMLRFELGNLVEDAVCQRIEDTAIDFLRTNQRHGDNIDVPGLGFRARSDFVFSCPEDLTLNGKATLELGDIAIAAYDGTPPKKGDICGGEIKSMSNYAYADAQRGVLDEAYLAQIECGLRALDVQWWCCIAYRAETSHPCEVWVARNDARWQQVQRSVEIARGPAIPVRPYTLELLCIGSKTGACVNGKTPARGQEHKHCKGTGMEPGGPYIPNWPCNFCGYKAECWSDMGELQISFDADSKPRWRVKP